MTVKVFKEADISTMAFGRNGSKVGEIQKTLKERYLKKPGECALLNDIVKAFHKGSSDSGLHSQLKGALDKGDFKVIKRQDRLVVVRLA